VCVVAPFALLTHAVSLPPTHSRALQNVLYQEIDYMNEGTNAELFRKNFEGTPWVKVPEVYWEKSAQRVLCMEYCPGLKINRVDEIERMGLDRSLLARYGVEAYLQQILRFGACGQQAARTHRNNAAPAAPRPC
jgi:predicted unusual protein kinase regulating ubiquinone biosynthesis (AarF/ABC1/UbiB family)